MPSRKRSGEERGAKQSTGPWRVHFFRRHPRGDTSESVPARDFLVGGPSLVLVTGLDKPFQTKLSNRDHDEVLEFVAEFRKRAPRSVLS